jgi:SanA protein
MCIYLNLMIFIKIIRGFLSTLLRYVSILLFISSLFVLGIDRWVSWQAEKQIVTEQNQVGQFQVAVVLGTSKYLGKTLNDYYTHRIEAAIAICMNKAR